MYIRFPTITVKNFYVGLLSTCSACSSLAAWGLSPKAAATPRHSRRFDQNANRSFGRFFVLGKRGFQNRYVLGNINNDRASIRAVVDNYTLFYSLSVSSNTAATVSSIS